MKYGINRFKRNLGKYIANLDEGSIMKSLFQRCNEKIFHKDEHEQSMSYGEKNPDKIFYVIRSFNKEQGLLSQWENVCREIIGAYDDGLIPIVDFANYQNMYWDGNDHNGTNNAWEYYFNQPTHVSLEEVYMSKNVILSGYEGRYFDRPNRPEISYDLVKKYADANEIVYEKMFRIIEQWGTDAILGVLARGSDYIACRPKNHPVQPDVDQIIAKIDEYLETYPEIKKILLATEDKTMYDKIYEKYKDMIIVTDNNLVENYQGQYLAYEIQTESMYQFGMDYLVKMMCLSRCDYFIAGRTAGSWFANLMNNGNYKDSYFWDLGVY